MKRRVFQKLNNKGAGIVTVLVAIIFLAAFGTLILTLSHTNFEMRISERKGKQTLYDASSVVEQLNAGIQDICSEAIVNAYANTLPRYNDFGSNVNIEFREHYRDGITGWFGPYLDGDNYVNPSARDPKGVLFDVETGTYNLNVLRAMIVEDEYGTIVIESTDPVLNANNKGVALNLSSEIVEGEKPDPIILKGLSVTFTKDGRTTRVQTDISIDYPSIPYSNQSLNNTSITRNACIIRGNLIQQANQGDCSIKGGAYFGNAYFTGAGSTFAFKRADEENSNSTFITPGNIEVSGYSVKSGGSEHFTLESGSTLWAGSVIVNDDGAVRLLGDTRVADDLNVKGKNADITLAGSYFGFGYSETENNQSSSILVNYRGQKDSVQGAKFNFANLDSLILAGRAFIQPQYYPEGVSSGESFSSKENQKAYLLPAEMVYYVYQNTRTQFFTNPEKMDTGKFQEIKSPDTALYPGDGFFIDENVYIVGKKTASDFGITGVKIAAETFDSSGKVMVYAFAEFESREKANEFFRAYYSTYPDIINTYLNRSVDSVSIETINQETGNVKTPTVITGGYFPYGNSQTLGYTPDSDFTVYVGLADIYQSQFDILTTTMNVVQIEEGGDEDPLDFILSENLSEISGDGYETYFNTEGKIVAIAANGDVEIKKAEANGKIQKIITVNGNTVQNADPDTVCLILSNGNIVVDNLNFNGLIVAEGNLEFKNSATLNEEHDKVSLALRATSGDGDSITEYIENADVNDVQEADPWAVTKLVTYENWKRSSDDE